MALQAGLIAGTIQNVLFLNPELGADMRKLWIIGNALALSLLLSGCSGTSFQDCGSDEAANVIAQSINEQITGNPFGGFALSLAEAFQPGAKDFVEATDFEFQDVILLEQDATKAICSGTLHFKKDGEWITLGGDFTWRVDQTEEGDNFYKWYQGRQNASVFY